MHSAALKQATTLIDGGIAAQAAALARSANDGVVLTNGADLTPSPVDWAWRNWLARGKFHILGGAPGQGKTTLAMAIAATMTVGGRWPDGSYCAKGNVLIWSGEDDPADTLLPRLMAMGADVSRVHFVTGSVIGGQTVPFDPARDLLALTEKAQTIGKVALLIVDPVVSAVAGDSHKNTEVRRALQPLVDLGAMLGAAVLGITHFSKGGAGKDPTERITGSVAFGALARVVIVAAKSHDDEGNERRIFARAKSNIGPDDGGFDYTMDQIELESHPGIFAARVLWGQALDGTARDLLGNAEDSEGDKSERDDAKAFLTSLLNDGPVSSKQVKADSDGAGYSWATIRRAQKEAGIEVVKQGFGKAGVWLWTLPKVLKECKGAHSQSVSNLSILGKSEHLRAVESAPTEASPDDVEVF